MIRRGTRRIRFDSVDRVLGHLAPMRDPGTYLDCDEHGIADVTPGREWVRWYRVEYVKDGRRMYAEVRTDYARPEDGWHLTYDVCHTRADFAFKRTGRYRGMLARGPGRASFRYVKPNARKGYTLRADEDGVEDRLYSAYYDEIAGLFDWRGVVSDCRANVEPPNKHGEVYGYCFLGTIMLLTPSGCYYTPWAHSNVTFRKARHDEIWWNALEQVAGEYGLFVTNSEGCPTDVLAGLLVRTEEEES